MCQDSLLGGAKCAAHTRPGYDALIAAMDAAAAKIPFGKDAARAKARQKFTALCPVTGQERNVANILADYASTKQGAERISADAERYKAEGDRKSRDVLAASLVRGRDRKEVAVEAKAAFVKAERAARNSMAVLRPHTGSFETSLAGRYPDFVAQGYWVATDNATEEGRHLEAHEVAAKSNAGVVLTCPEGHKMQTQRLNNVMNRWDTGAKPCCDTCQPRRQSSYSDMRAFLSGDLLTALGGNARYFDAFTPANRLEVLALLGLTKGDEDTLRRKVSTGIAHGDVTLAEVLKTEQFEKIDRKIRDRGDSDEKLDVIEDIAAVDAGSADRHWREAPVSLATSLASCGVADLVGGFCDGSPTAANLVEALLRQSMDQMWESAYRATAAATTTEEINAAARAHLDTFRRDAERLLAKAAKQGQRTTSSEAAVARFIADLTIVIESGIPVTYSPEQTNADGIPVALHPTLAQRRFAYLAVTDLVAANWSDTGAGKTISAVLSLASSGAARSLVLCPAPVVDQWAHQVSQALPGAEVRIGLPEHEAMTAQPEPGQQVVWVTNYDKFSGLTKERRDHVLSLAPTLDAIVLDEVHMAKDRANSTTSQRRILLGDFLDAARDSVSNLMVIGMSATPVVNCLSEARSILRLLVGREAISFQSKPTARNAAIAHRGLMAIGVRHLPTYSTTLTREEVVVDLDAAAMKRVHDRVARISAENGARSASERLVPAYMERALLPEKVPAVLAAAAKAKADGVPLMVYTHYVDGMVDPLVSALSEAGLRAASLTGALSAKERAAILADFRNGLLDALVGTSVTGTGIDGLQHVCHRMIVVSMPWTAAEDDQLTGRLHRRGQTKDVTVSYVLAESNLGKTGWSWCRNNRQKRVMFKRDIASAAVDGVLPDGMLSNGSTETENAAEALRALVTDQSAGAAGTGLESVAA